MCDFVCSDDLFIYWWAMYTFVVIYISRCLYKSDLRRFVWLSFSFGRKGDKLVSLLNLASITYTTNVFGAKWIYSTYTYMSCHILRYSTKRTWLQDFGKVFFDALFARVCRLFTSIYIYIWVYAAASLYKLPNFLL